MSVEIEYRVVPVTRFIVTRWHKETSGAAGVSERGEYQSENVAYEVGYALARAEHEVLGYELGDPRIKYPAVPGAPDAAPQA